VLPSTEHNVLLFIMAQILREREKNRFRTEDNFRENNEAVSSKSETELYKDM
jgi:hypothetical protein